MRKFSCEDQGADLVPLNNRFKITVEFTIESDSVENAETSINEVIQEGILALSNPMSPEIKGQELLYDYNIIDTELTEIF